MTDKKTDGSKRNSLRGEDREHALDLGRALSTGSAHDTRIFSPLTAKLQHLTWYAVSEPRKLPKIGRYLAKRTIVGIRRQRD